ncbi:MAG: hypothetical protein FJ278_20805, partial [Planctomycetes bacterium]|nr:hypothetical protein [Planctomycetota bacterium]
MDAAQTVTPQAPDTDFTFKLRRERPDATAYYVLSKFQKWLLVAILAVSLVWLAFDHILYLTVVNGIFTTF